MVKHGEIQELHKSDWFIYLHRYFLVWFERQLQKINAEFALFYWDTTKENAGWKQSKIWNYLGEQRGNVTVKALKNLFLERNCEFENLPSAEAYSSIYLKAKENYPDYVSNVETLHNQVHGFIGGQLGHPATSPLDPIFYAHHCHIDYVTFQNQLRLGKVGSPPSHSFGPHLTPKSELPGFPGIKIEDVFDVADLCISYAPPGSVNPGTSPGNSIPGNSPNTTIVDFPIEVKPEWLRPNVSLDDAQWEADKLKKELEKSVKNGTIIKTTIVINDQDREYVGFKKDGEENLRRLSGASSIQLGVSGLIILLTLFL
jgi:hypothetical protein